VGATFFKEYRGYLVVALLVFIVQFGLIVWLLVQWVRRRRIEEAMRTTSKLNRDLAGRLIASQEAERARIARDLHDDVCQEVAMVSVDLSHLRQSTGNIQSRDAQEILRALQNRAATVSESLRVLSHGLHPSVLDHIGLVAALQAHCVEVERHSQVHVKFLATAEVDRPTPLVALSLFRIAQEALKNATRHSHARQVTVSIAPGETGLTLTISDDGQGFDPLKARERGGLGLVSIEERVRLIGGHVTIDSQPGRGASLEVVVPLDGGQSPQRQGPSLLPPSAVSGK
jgi:two-component system sensor histidine kinase UhpB